MMTKRPRTPAQLANDEKLRNLRKKATHDAQPEQQTATVTTPEVHHPVHHALQAPSGQQKPTPVAHRRAPGDAEIPMTFVPANGRLDEAYTAIVPADLFKGAKAIQIGPFPEALRNYPEEWQDFEEIPITVDGERRTYPVTGPYTR
jgi:hypothetical protein